MDEIRQFAGSFSRLKNYEDCPRRYHEVDILKRWPEKKSTMLEEGDAIHAAMAHALKTNTPLPPTWQEHQKWVDKVRCIEGDLLVEKQLAITRDFQPTAWFSKQAWWRAIVDAAVLDTEHPMACLVDWKWGKSENASPIQLVLSSLVMFAHFPQLQVVHSAFVWLQEDDKTEQTLWRQDAQDQWDLLMPRIQLLEEATLANNFPPKPNRFCKRYCRVATCEYHGK
jgi:PD-(D/E)XK nuclease superfamily